MKLYEYSCKKHSAPNGLFCTDGTIAAYLPICNMAQIHLKRSRNRDIEDAIFSHVGILPILDHYYQPLINPKKHLKKSLRHDRVLPGIDFNDAEQLSILNAFDYNKELLQFPVEKRSETDAEEFFL